MAGAEESAGCIVGGILVTAFSLILFYGSFAGIVADRTHLSSSSVYRMLAQIEIPGQNRKEHRLLVVQDRKNESTVYCVYNEKGVVLPDGTTFVEKVNRGVKSTDLSEKPTK